MFLPDEADGKGKGKKNKRAHKTVIVMLNQAEQEGKWVYKGKNICGICVFVLCLYKDMKVVGSMY